MNVTFLATINLDDLSDLPGVAQEISDDLSASGFEVLSVEPWARPSITQGTTLTIVPTTPTIQTQPNDII